MSDWIKCKFQGHSWLKLEFSNEHMEDEVSSHFKYEIPNWQILKRVNRRLAFADGYIRFYKKRSHELPFGLLRRLKEFCDNNNYRLELDPLILKEVNPQVDETSVGSYIQTLGIPFPLRDYQITAVTKALRNKRTTLISPTSSGKSATIYAIVSWVRDHELKPDEKILIVVPNKGLLIQLRDNFVEYGYKGSVHLIQQGAEKDSSDNQIYISTYHSIYKLGPEYFRKFKCLVLDECHAIQASKTQKCVEAITNNCINASYRIAMTGTYFDEKIHRVAIEGLYGPIYDVITTSELIERGQVAKFKVNAIHITYPEDITRELQHMDWQTCKEFQEANDNPRQQLIIKLAESLDENTMILFNLIEHGKYLHSQLVNNSKRKSVYYIDGEISGEERMEIVSQMEKERGHVDLHFGNNIVRFCRNDDIILKNGSVKKAKDITEEDDVDETFLKGKGLI